MKSKTFEQAKKFYTENKADLINLLYAEYHGTIDVQEMDNGGENPDIQVAVWFVGFCICYQSSDMNGNGKGKAHWDNPGADTVFDELTAVLSKDERFQPLIAEEEYHANEYLTDFINDFCRFYAEKHDIESYFQQIEGV